MSRVVVVGTGTGVGKTTLCVAWLRELVARGVDAVGWKPVETRGDADEVALASACGRRLPAAFRFEIPISPHLAARRAGTRIRVEDIVDGAQELGAETAVLVIETAGGMFSPLDDAGATNAELVRALKPDGVVLVGPNRLGVLHDVTAAVRAAELGGVAIHAVVLTDAELRVDDLSRADNADELARLVKLPVVELRDRRIGADEARRLGRAVGVGS